MRESWVSQAQAQAQAWRRHRASSVAARVERATKGAIDRLYANRGATKRGAAATEGQGRGREVEAARSSEQARA